MFRGSGAVSCIKLNKAHGLIGAPSIKEADTCYMPIYPVAWFQLRQRTGSLTVCPFVHNRPDWMTVG